MRFGCCTLPTGARRTASPLVAHARYAGCGTIPQWHDGEGQIRMITARSEAEANDRKGALMSLLSRTGGENWTKHVVNATPTLPIARGKRDHQIYVVTLNQIEAEPDLVAGVCDWLKCKGVTPGDEPCGTRAPQSALGKLGLWPGPAK